LHILFGEYFHWDFHFGLKCSSF